VGEDDCLASYTEIEAKRIEFGVTSVRVLIDCAFETREVYAQSVAHSWTCMRGVDRDSFKHKREVLQNGVRTVIVVELPYSEAQWADPFSGTEQQQFGRQARIVRRPLRLARRFDWINLHIKNLLSAFKQGNALYWGLPGDVGAEYLRQINAEVRHTIVNARGQRVEWWSNVNVRTTAAGMLKTTGTKRANHAWDCECMILVAMCQQHLVDLSDWQPDAAVSTSIPSVSSDLQEN
jgi:hypothetical protein